MESEKKDQGHRLKIPDKWVIIFLGVIYLARICHGMYMSIPGPTLLYLSANVNSTVEGVAPIFVGRSGGMLIGAVIASFVLRYGRPMASLGIAVFLSGVSMVFIPFVSSVTILSLLITSAGIMAGYLDAGMQALLLRLWGEKDSRPHLQAFHFAFTIGAIIAPLIVRPFLVLASQTRKDDIICPNANVTAVSQGISDNSTAITTANLPEFNPVGWAYIIAATYMVIISLLFAWLAVINIDQKIKLIRQDAKCDYEQREQPTCPSIWYILFLIMLFYFCMNGAEHPYIAYIYGLVVCELGFSESSGSILNTVFWSGMCCGRTTGIVASNFLHPRTIIIICLSGCLVSMVIMSIFGHYPAIPWIVSFSYAFFISPLYPAGVSWASSTINISGKYLHIFNIGQGAGSMSMTPLGGVIFQKNPFSVIYFSNGLICLHCLTFAAMILSRKYYLKQNKILKETDSSEQSELPLL